MSGRLSEQAMKHAIRRSLSIFAIFLFGAAALVAQAVAGPPAPEPAAPPPVTVPQRIDPWAAAPAAEKQVFAVVDGLVAQGKWKSAWNALAAADAAHGDPWFLAREIDLALSGSVDTREHLAFTFVDLDATTSLDKARSAAVGQGEIAFDPLALADAQTAAKIEAVPVLHFELGRYLGEVAERYQGAWRLSDEEIAVRESEARAAARDAGVYDAASLQAEAEYYLNIGDPKDAEILVVAAEGLGNPTPRLRYDHAIALLLMQRSEEALAIVDSALAADTDPNSRISGLSLAAQAASLAGQDDKVESYLSRAEQESPDSTRPLLFGHYLYVSRGEEDKANAVADRALKRFGPDPQLVSTLVKTWFDSADPAAALPFLDRGLDAYPTDDSAMTIFGLYKAMVLLRVATGPADLKDVGPLLDATQAHADKAFPGRQEVADAIQSMREGLAQLTNPPPPAPMAPPTGLQPKQDSSPAPTAPAPATGSSSSAGAATPPTTTPAP